MVLRNLDRKRSVFKIIRLNRYNIFFFSLLLAFSVYFDYGDHKQKTFLQYELVDVRTIRFKTPACLLPMYDEHVRVPIIVEQNERVIGKFDFLYLNRMLRD